MDARDIERSNIDRLAAASGELRAKFGRPAKLKRHRAITLKPHKRADGTCVEPVIILDCDTTTPIRVDGADICYPKEGT